MPGDNKVPSLVLPTPTRAEVPEIAAPGYHSIPHRSRLTQPHGPRSVSIVAASLCLQLAGDALQRQDLQSVAAFLATALDVVQRAQEREP